MSVACKVRNGMEGLKRIDANLDRIHEKTMYYNPFFWVMFLFFMGIMLPVILLHHGWERLWEWSHKECEEN